MTIAIDFDGTIVEHRYPKIGNEIPFAIDTLKMLIKAHHRLILWTVREGKLLDEAVEWCRERGVEFYRPSRFLAQSKSGHLHRRPQLGRPARLGRHLPHGSGEADVRGAVS